jgi:hypothetical protein
LDKLASQDLLESYNVYPFIARFEDGCSNREIAREIVAISESCQPTGILWCHTGNLALCNDHLNSIKSLSSKPSMGFWDGDIYHKFYKPLPKQSVHIAKKCDVSFLPGYSAMIQDLITKGCKDIRYVPLSTDEERFGRKRELGIIYDVVMVGNYIRSSVPFKTFPGSRYRKKIADCFYDKLGERFAVFGRGWKGKYAKGPVSYEKQSEIYHLSRLSIGVNNLHSDYYYSDRLPISLSSGVIMVHNYEKGIDKIFEDIGYTYFFKDIFGAWKITEALLEKQQSTLDSIACKYSEFALKKLSMYTNLEYITAVLKDLREARIKNKILVDRVNPWIGNIRF